METLWAPWRMVYVENSGSQDCFFCRASAERPDERNLILYRGKLVFVQMNLYPYNPGHVMIAPYRHVAELDALSVEEQLELIRASARTTALLGEAMKPNGFNLGLNLGKTAGAGIEHHLHVHIVPRWDGDTNFMPLVAHTRVIPEALSVTYRKLAPIFAKDLA